MLKIGQNWGKIANYPPNAQQRSAPLDVLLYNTFRKYYYDLINIQSGVNHIPTYHNFNSQFFHYIILYHTKMN